MNASASSSSTPDLHGPARILLLEDLPLVQKVMRELLDGPAYEICGICETESEALRKFDELSPDVVIIDLKLKEGTGLGFLQKRIRRDGHVPLLMVVTNHAISSIESACKKAGADHFFDKSRDLLAVRQAIDSWRDTRQAA